VRDVANRLVAVVTVAAVVRGGMPFGCCTGPAYVPCGVAPERSPLTIGRIRVDSIIIGYDL